MWKGSTLRSRVAGTTLIETLIVGFILSIVVGITASLFAAGSRNFSRETTAVALQGDLAGAKNVLLDDLSIAGYLDTLGAFVVAATTGPTDSIALIGDVDSDNVPEKICYQVVSAELRRTVQNEADACGIGTIEVLASGIQGFDVTFLDGNRAVMTDAAVVAGPANVRHVRVRLQVTAMAKGGAIDKTISGEVAIRN